jgi:sialate O-acetylesterase
VRVSFLHANGGLKSSTGGPLTGFEVAGSDRVWKRAEASVSGDTVTVRSPDVARPIAVRYAWKDWPEYSLANGAGLPASPFRTDDWPVRPETPQPIKP